MDENWVNVPGFAKYEVSDHGNMRFKATGRPLRYFENKYGSVHVGLMKAGVQRRRSVCRLVAEAFVPNIKPVFDTPICLNGDRWDLHKDNLMWRPRWFAIQYNKQFANPPEHRIDRPIREIFEYGHPRLYDGSLHVAVSNGLLESDVVLSILNNTYTWPNYQKFEVVV